MNRNPINAATPNWMNTRELDSTPTLLATRDLGYNANTRTFYADASDVPGTATNAYNVQGHRHTLRFQYIETEHDAEGEATAFRFSSPAGYTLVLFND